MEGNSTQPECTVRTLKEWLSIRCPSNTHTLSMDAQSEAQSLSLFEAVQHMRLSTVFDYLVTLEQEVDLIWGSEWTITKLLYLITRYSPFVNAVLFLWQQVTPNMSAESCLLVYKMNGWMATAGIILAEVILTLRTLAVWNRHRMLAGGLLTLFSAITIAAFAVMGIFQGSLQFQILPIPDFTFCFVSAANPIFRWDYILWMFYEVVMLLLMVVKSYQQFRQAREIGSSQLMNVILKDGVTYYIYLSVLNITNVIVISSLSPELLGLLGLLERVIHAMLACRVITNIRAQAKKQVIHGSKGTIDDLGSTGGSSVGMVVFAAHDSTGSLE
ncbi:hypothetical protein BDZ89DRAFT_1062035 [Hymenopellis radicata]|nr:hypothetical protein BDZ89DRAFT_1062035 [Hymenopellis radicata]